MQEASSSSSSSLCGKCGVVFANNRSLEKHERSKNGSCIGAWFVCKRCTRFFDRQCDLERHQASTIVCASQIMTPLDANVPREVSAWIRYEKAIRDNQSAAVYLERVVKRMQPDEVHTVLEACSLADLDVFLRHLVVLRDCDHGSFIKLLSQVSNFANMETTSLEKRAQIREFIDNEVVVSF